MHNFYKSNAAKMGEWHTASHVETAVTDEGTVIDMRLTQQELAELAGMTRETMARTLREFQQAGCIRVESGIISILALDMLRREVRQA